MTPARLLQCCLPLALAACKNEGAATVRAAEDSGGSPVAALTALPESTEHAATQAARLTFLEGPATTPDGRLIFSDVAGNQMLELVAGAPQVFRKPSNRSNGNMVGPDGKLYTCEGNEGEGGGRRIARTDLATNTVEAVTDAFDGQPYSNPNDLTFDAKGRLWFTDPHFGTDDAIFKLPPAVYRIDDPTAKSPKVVRVLPAEAIKRPNGIAVAPDLKTLYVVDSHPDLGSPRKIWAFTLDDAGTPSGQRTLVDFGGGRGADGIRVDADGHLWAAAGIQFPRGKGEAVDVVRPGVYRFDPSGKPELYVKIPEDVVTNLAFGGPGDKTLFVTAGRTIYKIDAGVAGFRAPKRAPP